MKTNNMVTEHAIGATTIKPDNKVMANSRNIQQSQYNNTEQYFELESDESIWVITTKKNINMNEQYHTTYRKIITLKNARAWVSMVFIHNVKSAPIAIEKIKILGAILELPAKQHC